MPRRPMTEEEKQAAKERMKKMWAERKAKEQPEQPKGEAKEPEAKVVTGIKPEQVSAALALVLQAKEFMHVVHQQRPDMIEAAQAEEFLIEAERKMGQVEGLI